MQRRTFGSIFRRHSRDGSLLPRFYVRFHDGSGRPRVRAAGRTRESAEALLDALLGEVRLARGRTSPPPDAGRRQDASALPLASLAPEVLEVWRATLSAGTLRDRKGSLGRWARRLPRAAVASLTRADVEAAVREMSRAGLAASTIRTEVGILSAAFQTLRKALRLPLGESPCRGVLLPPIQALPRPHISPEDLDRLLQATPERYRAPLMLLADAGLRPAELLRLTWAEVDLRLGALRLARTKTYQTRTLPLTTRAREVLEEAAAEARDGPGAAGGPPPGARVFPLSEKGLRRGFREAVKAAGLPKELVLYSLRHAYATGLLLEQAPPAVVRDLLGHANIKTTDIYLRSLPGNAARAAVDALERARGATGARHSPAVPGAPAAAGTGAPAVAQDATGAATRPP